MVVFIQSIKQNQHIFIQSIKQKIKKDARKCVWMKYSLIHANYHLTFSKSLNPSPTPINTFFNVFDAFSISRSTSSLKCPAE